MHICKDSNGLKIKQPTERATIPNEGMKELREREQIQNTHVSKAGA